MPKTKSFKGDDVRKARATGRPARPEEPSGDLGHGAAFNAMKRIRARELAVREAARLPSQSSDDHQ